MSIRVLSKPELRLSKLDRGEFATLVRNPITVVLDGVRQNYNLGAVFRLCDAFLVERLMICGAPVLLRKHKLRQAAQGSQKWVPWQEQPDAAAFVQTAKATGSWIVVAELSTNSIEVSEIRPHYPAVLVLGGERSGVSPEVLACADQVVAVPMLGMANSLNVATTAAIVLHELVRGVR